MASTLFVCLPLFIFLFRLFLGMTGLSGVVLLHFSVNPAYFLNSLSGILLPEG